MTILAGSINLNGLQISGDKPINPATKKFLNDKGAIVEQKDGKVAISGSYSLSAREVQDFLKTQEDNSPLIYTKPTPITKLTSTVNMTDISSNFIEQLKNVTNTTDISSSFIASAKNVTGSSYVNTYGIVLGTLLDLVA